MLIKIVLYYPMTFTTHYCDKVKSCPFPYAHDLSFPLGPPYAGEERLVLRLHLHLQNRGSERKGSSAYLLLHQFKSHLIFW